MSPMGTVITFIKAVPMIKSMFDQLVDFYIESEISKIHDKRITQKEKRNALLLSISRSKTDYERETYSIMLADIMR